MIKRNLLALGLVLGLFAATCPALEATPDSPQTAPAIPPDAKIDSLLALLPDADYATKGEIATRLGAEGSPAAHRALAALLAGELYRRNSDRSLVSVGEDSKPHLRVLAGKVEARQCATQGATQLVVGSDP